MKLRMVRKSRGTAKVRKSKAPVKVSAARVWAEVEDRFVPTFAPWPSERVVYLRLLRRTRLAGRSMIRVSLLAFSEDAQISTSSLRKAYARLQAKGAIRIHERGYTGHLIQVFLPSEISGIGQSKFKRLEPDVETVNFFRRSNLRPMIYAREKQRCFYCGRRLRDTNRGIDHVVARSKGGDDSYRNVVACCLECNSLKGERPAEKFMELLSRLNVLSRKGLRRRLAALAALRQGRLRPNFAALRTFRKAA